jgi:hypothetical protein
MLAQNLPERLRQVRVSSIRTCLWLRVRWSACLISCLAALSALPWLVSMIQAPHHAVQMLSMHMSFVMLCRAEPVALIAANEILC